MKQEEKILHIAESKIETCRDETLKLQLLLKLLHSSLDTIIDSASINYKNIDKLNELIDKELEDLTWIFEIAIEYCDFINKNLDELTIN